MSLLKLWNTIELYLFPALEEDLGEELSKKEREFISGFLPQDCHDRSSGLGKSIKNAFNRSSQRKLERTKICRRICCQGEVS